MSSRLLSILVAMQLVAASAARADSADCGVFVLKRDHGRIVLERVPVSSGQVTVLPADSASGVIDVVFPVGPGVSTGIAQPEGGRMFVLRCADGRLHCEVRKGGKGLTSYPDRDLADLARYDTRISVVGGDGTRVAFLLEGYAQASSDPGPVQNLLAGAMKSFPLGNSDCIVTTDTYPQNTGTRVMGEAPLEVNGHPFVRVTGPNGRTGWFIVDTGAVGTVVAKGFLPDSSRIEKSTMVEYSSTGRRVLNYQPSGATGPVLNVLGHTQLAELRLGSLRFTDVVTDVLPDMPDYFGRPVMGIIGLDLLRRADRVTIEYPRGGKGAGVLRLGGSERATPGEARVPFSLVSSHLTIPVRVNGTESFMMLDTGAPGALLDSAGAVSAGMTFTANRKVKGLDGNAISSAGATMTLDIGMQRLDHVDCQVSALPVFNAIRGDRPMGLFGNSLIARFERLVIDFLQRSIFLAGLREAR